MIFLVLFFTFAYFGCCCFSGGGMLVQFYLDTLVNQRHWMTFEELGNFMAISQVTPGPIGVNLATFLGYTQGGFWGGLVSTAGLLFPSFVLMTLALKSYQKWQGSGAVKGLMYGVRPVCAALVATTFAAFLGMSLLTHPIPFEALLKWNWGAFRNLRLRWEMLPVFLFALWGLRTKKLSIIWVIFVSALMGMILHQLGR